MIGSPFLTRACQPEIEDARLSTRPGMASWAGADPLLHCDTCLHFDRNRAGNGHCLLFEAIRRGQRIKVDRVKTRLLGSQRACTKHEPAPVKPDEPAPPMPASPYGPGFTVLSE
jgi:hypothetical protein